jgi:hypothetical protein
LSIKKKFYNLEHRFACQNNTIIILPKFPSQFIREKVEIIFPDDIGLRVAAESFPEGAIGRDDLKVPIFRKKRDASQMVEEHLEV